MVSTKKLYACSLLPTVVIFILFHCIAGKYIWFITINLDDNVSSDVDDIDDDHSTQKITVLAWHPWIFGMCCKYIDGILERRFFKVEKRDKATLLVITNNTKWNSTRINYLFRSMATI
jgi:hypothetical protein